MDLRREIIDVGSIQRLIELRKQRRQRRAERAATPEPTPPPEPLEIVRQGSQDVGGGCWDRGWTTPRPAPGSPCHSETSLGEAGQEAPMLSPLLHPCAAPALSLCHCQEGPVEPETFLRAAVQGKMHVIEKFLADGGSPDTCDEVASLAATGCPPCLLRATKSCSHAPPCLWARAGTLGTGLEVQPDWARKNASILQCATLSASSTAQPCTAPRWRDTWKSCRSSWTVGPLLTSGTG